MDIRNAARQVEEARGMLTQAISDASVCQLDLHTLGSFDDPSPSWVFVPDPDALRHAVAALDRALEDLENRDRENLAEVVELLPTPIAVPPQAVFARIPAQREIVRGA